jgi:hypothetical protein
MSGSSIAAEVAAGLAEAAADLSDGAFSISIVRGAATPANPWDIPAGTPVTTAATGIVQEYPRKLIDGTLIRADDRRVMLSATGLKPTVADKLSIGGQSYSIVSVMESAPAGIPLYYEVQARI